MPDAIADYEVVEPWGGAQGRYLCRPPARLGRQGRVMVSQLAVDAEGWQQLSDSLVRLAAASEGRLLEMVEAGQDPGGGGAFVVSEAPNGSLAEPGREMDRRDTVGAVEAAARAAHALHEAGLAHGFIHPGSVLLTDRGPALDLPRLDSADGEVIRVGRWQELVATDPELLAGEAPGRGSDIWSLGATLHCSLSRRPLFPGIEADEPVTAVQRVMFTRPEPDPDLPEGLRDLIASCLSPDPADRPPTALAVAERLAGAEVER